MNTEFINKSRLEQDGSANRYEEVTFSGGTYAPDIPFKGIHVNQATTVISVGLDGIYASFVLAAGTHPIAGVSITEAGTSPTTGIIALF
jgi:hypothetical protein